MAGKGRLGNVKFLNTSDSISFITWCKDIPRQRHQICSIKLPGFSLCQFKMQALLSQPAEACQTHLDSNVQTRSSIRGHSC
ncbi:hypothetical protein OPV22_026410 [Ensete ventricosum]|uniref:Uncharacterized protein n=1 Tax=Ensete ventricosum TaxID=4639 RepID=A0AAV8QJY5_ENSVE|nr:hypothetical protein OPV22_026410 [Ensete ventricosum]